MNKFRRSPVDIGKYPIIYRVSKTSQVVQDFFHHHILVPKKMLKSRKDFLEDDIYSPLPKWLS